MQQKTTSEIEKILLAIAAHLNVKRLRGLAAAIGVSEGAVYAWVKRGKIGNPGAILSKLPNINLKWLETGEGPMFSYQPPPGDAIALNLKNGVMGAKVSGKGKIVNQTATIQEGMKLSSEEETLIKLIRRKDKAGDLTFQLIEQVSKM